MYEEVKVWQLSLIGLMSVAAITILVLLLQIVYLHSTRQVHERDFSQPPAELSQLLAEQQARLLEYRLIDPKKERVAIPIERAEQLVLRELARREAPPKE